MSPTSAIIIASLILGVAAAMARWEWRSYRAYREGKDAIIPYSLTRLLRRMSGILVLCLLSLSIGGLGLAPPVDAFGLTLYINAILFLSLLLAILALWDVIATARGPILAFPHKDDPYMD